MDKNQDYWGMEVKYWGDVSPHPPGFVALPKATPKAFSLTVKLKVSRGFTVTLSSL